MFGGGWYTARYSMIDAVNELRFKNGLDYLRDQIYQPSAYNAILVDTGFIGLALILANLLFSVFAIYKSNTKHRIYISTTLLLIIIFSFIGNFTPLLLSFILIMPNSPILMMINSDDNYYN